MSASSSSSSSLDDEERAKLILAVDPEFTNNFLQCQQQQLTQSNTLENVDKKFRTKEEKQSRLACNNNGGRTVRMGEGINGASTQSSSIVIKKNSVRDKALNCDEEFPKPYSLNVTLETQNFIAKKLSNALDTLLDEVVVDISSSVKKKKKEGGIYLFSSSESRISRKDLEQVECPQIKQKRPKLIKRKRHVNGSESEDEDTKLRTVAVSAEWVKTNVLY